MKDTAGVSGPNKKAETVMNTQAQVKAVRSKLLRMSKQELRKCKCVTRAMDKRSQIAQDTDTNFDECMADLLRAHEAEEDAMIAVAKAGG